MRQYPERDLIQGFESIMKQNENVDMTMPTNFGNNTTILADIEYVSSTGEYMVIEAKSNHSRDAHNSVHKLFGELLKETGKNKVNRLQGDQKASLAVLIPEDASTRDGVTKNSGYNFYKRHFNNIPHDIFEKFGELVNARYVFIYSKRDNCVKQYSWIGFYQGEEPLETWSSLKY
ncbi:hypothetical protein [Virgibacillus kimchii]